MPGILTFVHNNIHVVSGEAPFDFPDMNIGFATFLLDLPPISRSPAVLTSSFIYGMLSQASRLELVEVCANEPRLLSRLRYLLTNFAAFARPDTKVWPTPANEAILEETIVRAQPVDSIICLLDGTRYVSEHCGDYSALMTFAEWRALYEIAVPEYLDTLITSEITRLSRVVQLTSIEAPSSPIEITYMRLTEAGEAVAGNLTFKQYLPDQIIAYCERHHITVTSCTAKELTDVKPK